MSSTYSYSKKQKWNIIKYYLQYFYRWVKEKTIVGVLDLSLWFLFFIGFVVISYVMKDDSWSDKLSVIVLWFTAIVIFQYTKETRLQNRLSIMPYVILNYHDNHPDHGKVFYLQNIGKGVAQNVKIKPIIYQPLFELIGEGVGITFPTKTVISPNSGYTFIKPVIIDSMLSKSGLPKDDLMDKIIEKIKPKFGEYRNLEIEIMYEDVFGNPYKTILVTSEFEDGYHVKKYKKKF